MAIENVTLFAAVADWESGTGNPTQQSATQTGGLGKYIRHLGVSFTEGSSVVTSVTLRIQVADPIDGSWIYLTGQSAPGTNAIVFNAYDLSAVGTLTKWVAVGANMAAEQNNGWIMLPSDSWRAQLAVTSDTSVAAMTIVAQLSDGMS